MYANPVNQLMCAAGAYKNRYKLLIQNNAKAGEKKAAEKKPNDRAAEKKSLRKAQTSFICPTIFYSFLFRYGVFFLFFLIRFSRSFVYKNAGDLID